MTPAPVLVSYTLPETTIAPENLGPGPFSGATVDGRNHAPADIVKIQLFTGRNHQPNFVRFGGRVYVLPPIFSTKAWCQASGTDNGRFVKL